MPESGAELKHELDDRLLSVREKVNIDRSGIPSRFINGDLKDCRSIFTIDANKSGFLGWRPCPVVVHINPVSGIACLQPIPKVKAYRSAMRQPGWYSVDSRMDSFYDWPESCSLTHLLSRTARAKTDLTDRRSGNDQTVFTSCNSTHGGHFMWKPISDSGSSRLCRSYHRTGHDLPVLDIP